MASEFSRHAAARDIDRLIDEALRHPDRAERIKESLRQKVLGTDTGRRAAPVEARESASVDLWDNVPV